MRDGQEGDRFGLLLPENNSEMRHERGRDVPSITLNSMSGDVIGLHSYRRHVQCCTKLFLPLFQSVKENKLMAICDNLT